MASCFCKGSLIEGKLEKTGSKAGTAWKERHFAMVEDGAFSALYLGALWHRCQPLSAGALGM